MYTLELNNKTNNWDLIDGKGNVEIENIWSDSDAEAILSEYNS